MPHVVILSVVAGRLVENKKMERRLTVPFVVRMTPAMLVQLDTILGALRKTANEAVSRASLVRRFTARGIAMTENTETPRTHKAAC